MSISKSFENIDSIITEIKLYKQNVEATRKFSFGVWNSRQHIFLEIKSDLHYGYGENIISVNNPQVLLSEWGAYVKELKGKTVSDAIHFTRQNIGVWPSKLTEAIEMSLIDLSGKIKQKSAGEMLKISGNKSIPGVFVILSDDASFVREQSKFAVENNQSTYIKVKLFGNKDIDIAIINAVRQEAPRENTFLIGDVNGGYSVVGKNVPIAQIATELNALYEAGLDACEDPAYIDNDGWVLLQESVNNLSLIPDYPLRPSQKAIAKFNARLGKIYNIHPGCTGSIFDAVSLALCIKEHSNAEIMIGDDSLIGPGCTAWQQIAIGLEAKFTEAVEKNGDSDIFNSLITQIATQNDNFVISFSQAKHGFGLKLNRDKLCETSAEVLSL